MYCYLPRKNTPCIAATELLSHGITSTEGRQLKLQQKSVMSTRNFNFYRRNLDGDSDDFRPTNPGHSPGAGHSNGPSSKP
uniref:Uncharacterized protein n=1 Tax=Manihot esculenta TaxID=3983 RepID=A0A2C9U1S7_MANES